MLFDDHSTYFLAFFFRNKSFVVLFFGLRDFGLKLIAMDDYFVKISISRGGCDNGGWIQSKEFLHTIDRASLLAREGSNNVYRFIDKNRHFPANF